MIHAVIVKVRVLQAKLCEKYFVLRDRQVYFHPTFVFQPLFVERVQRIMSRY